jgi:hypothetical protein
MATATRSTRSTRSKQPADTRKPNFTPNHLPMAVVFTVLFGGIELGTVEAPQGPKLSDKGNISFMGGIKEGWELGEGWMDALAKLSFTANGVLLKVAESGVHTSESGNPTVGHFGVITLPSALAEGEGSRYRAEVYATWLVKKGSFSLSTRAFVHVSPAAGPQVVGEVSGLVVSPRA